MSRIETRIERLEKQITPAETSGPMQVICVEFYKGDPGVDELIAKAEAEAAALPPGPLPFKIVLIEKSRGEATCSESE